MPTTIELFSIGATLPDLAQLEGHSFLPLLLQPSLAPSLWKNATFTQYPRCSSDSVMSPSDPEEGLAPWLYPSDSPCTAVASDEFRAMGYSIRTDRWRYTLWLRWNGTAVVGWDGDAVVGEELYDHAGDDGFDTDKYDNINLDCREPQYAAVCTRHRAALEAGWQQALPEA